MKPEASVSAIIPARNEEAVIARAVESLAAQPEIAEIIVVDDQSTDGTASILSGLAARVPRVRILEAGQLPAGWVGKNYALSIGAARACGLWLLFTDADTVHLPGSTARALADAAAHDAAVVSYSPTQETHSWWENALIPFVFSRLAALFSYDEVNNPASPVAAANGQFLFIRREAYNAIGGHRSVSSEILEDVALARLVKAAGYRLHFASGEGIVHARMYDSFGAMWQGWTKNLYPLIGATPTRLARELMTVVPWIPLTLIALGLWRPLLAVLGLVLLAGRHVGYAATLRRSHFPLSRIQYYFVGVFLYAGALLTSAWRYRRGFVVWKGRQYPVGASGDSG